VLLIIILLLLLALPLLTSVKGVVVTASFSPVSYYYYYSQGKLVAEEVKYVFTCAVGRRQTHASFYAQNSTEIRDLLAGLAEAVA